MEKRISLSAPHEPLPVRRGDTSDNRHAAVPDRSGDRGLCHPTAANMSITITSKIMYALSRFQTYAKLETFRLAFGDHGADLFREYRENCSENTVDFYMRLSAPDKQSFLNYLVRL
jgi:hypothetical protein